MMKLFLIFIIMTASFVSVADNLENVSYTFSSECVSSVEIQKSNYGNYWELYIELQADEAMKLKIFSESHINNLLSIYDGKGSHLIDAKIMESISSPIMITANDEKEAVSIKESLLMMPGKCGNESVIY